jgi:hypothetical protein
MKRVLLLSLALILGGCASGGSGERGDRVSGGTITIPGDAMSGPLLPALRNRIRTMTVTSAGTPCPRIIFRGSRSVLRQGEPSVYLDGALMADTCILLQIDAADVEYVTVYAGGANIPAGFQHNPFGTIIVQRVRR